MITNPITAVETMIEGIKKSSRMFNEPPPPKPTNESLAADLNEVIDELHETALNIRRLENKIVLIKARLEGMTVGL